MGLLTELAKDRDDLMAKARAWIAANPKAKAALGPAEVQDPRRRFALAGGGAAAGHRAFGGVGQELGQLPRRHSTS